MIDNNVLDYNLVEELRKKRYDGDKLLTDSSREYELALTKFDNNDFNTESITKILGQHRTKPLQNDTKSGIIKI